MDLFESVIKPRHYCNIYRSSDDLQKTIAEYFKTGLKKNELCICITSDDLTEMGLKKAMQKNGIAFESAISAGKLEIHHYKTWYLNDGVFDKGRVLKAWEDKILKALADGYSGVRVTGSADWISPEMFSVAAQYEKEFDGLANKYPIVGVCNYSREQTDDKALVQAMSNHNGSFFC